MNISQLRPGMLVYIRNHRDNNSPIGKIRINSIEKCINSLFIKINGHVYYKCQIESIILE